MTRLTFVAVVLAVAATGPGSVYAEGQSLTGTWTLTAEHASIKLILRQTENTLTGELNWPHGDPIKLTGRVTGDMVTFTGDSGGDNFTIHIDSTATLDETIGALTGVFKAHFVDFNDAHEVVRQTDQEIPWTAVRGEIPAAGQR